MPVKDLSFLLALLHVIFAERLECTATAVPLSGVDEIRTMALAAPLDELADRCGVAVDVIRDVARRFATAARGMCITHTAVSHTPTGTIAEWLATVLNAETGRAHVWTPVPNAHLVCLLLLENKNTSYAPITPMRYSYVTSIWKR